mgnify:CR=1 FL=1
MGRTVLSERYDCRNAGRNCRYFLRLQNEPLGSTGFRPMFNNTDVQSVFEITREIFAGHFEKIQEKYGNKEMGSDLLTVVGQMTGSKELIRMSRNMEVNSMCEALEKLKEEGKLEGIEVGREEGIKENRKEVILTMLQNNYPISEICKLLNIPEEEVLEIRDKK